MRVVQRTWATHEFRVETAATGRDGLASYHRIGPDLALLDFGLPDMDGLDVLRSIRRRASMLMDKDAQRASGLLLRLAAQTVGWDS